jgi:hypothetical protein
MTREEALLAMRDGKKVTHRLFKNNEFLYMTEGAILTQDYYNVGDETCEFWKAHSDSCWQKDWLLYEEVKEANSTIEEVSLEGKEIFYKKHFIVNFLNKNSSPSIKEAWASFKKEWPNFCSSLYFSKVFKSNCRNIDSITRETHPANIEGSKEFNEANSAAFLEEKQSIEEGLGDKQINAIKNLIGFQEKHSKEEYQNKCVLCEKTFMAEQKSLVCPECTLKAKKQTLKDFVFNNEDLFKETFDDGYQLCMQHEQGGLKIKYDNFEEWFINFKKQFE